jgi:hypothetical protein
MECSSGCTEGYRGGGCGAVFGGPSSCPILAAKLATKFVATKISSNGRKKKRPMLPPQTWTKYDLAVIIFMKTKFYKNFYKYATFLIVEK